MQGLHESMAESPRQARGCAAGHCSCRQLWLQCCRTVHEARHEGGRTHCYGPVCYRPPSAPAHAATTICRQPLLGAHFGQARPEHQGVLLLRDGAPRPRDAAADERRVLGLARNAPPVQVDELDLDRSCGWMVGCNMVGGLGGPHYHQPQPPHCRCHARARPPAEMQKLRCGANAAQRPQHHGSTHKAIKG